MRLPLPLLLAACGASATTPPAPAPEIIPGDEAPGLPLDRPDKRPLDTCSFALVPKSDAKVRELFTRRHGTGWMIDTDRVTGYLLHLGLPGPQPSRRDIAQASAEQRAAAFLHADHDLFGLTDADLAGATSVTRDRHDEWELEWSASHPTPGYQQFPSMTRAWRVTIDVDDRGVSAAFAQLPFPPEAAACPPPTIDEAAARRAVLGQPLVYEGWSGKASKGTVTENTIARVVLDFVQLDPSKHTVQLAYSIDLDVENGTPMFRAFVDPYSGKLLTLFPLFMS